jgi:hypothetical protein
MTIACSCFSSIVEARVMGKQVWLGGLPNWVLNWIYPLHSIEKLGYAGPRKTKPWEERYFTPVPGS